MVPSRTPRILPGSSARGRSPRPSGSAWTSIRPKVPLPKRRARSLAGPACRGGGAGFVPAYEELTPSGHLQEGRIELLLRLELNGFGQRIRLGARRQAVPDEVSLLCLHRLGRGPRLFHF